MEVGSGPGRALLEAIRDGAQPPPPLLGHLGMRVAEVGDGLVTIAGVPDHRHLNLLGTLHGGVAAVLIDSATWCAVHSVQGPGMSCVTLEVDYHLLRAVRPGPGELRCEGRVVHAGRTVASATAEVLAPDGRLVARGSSLCLVTPVAGGPATGPREADALP